MRFQSYGSLDTGVSHITNRLQGAARRHRGVDGECWCQFQQLYKTFSLDLYMYTLLANWSISGLAGTHRRSQNSLIPKRRDKSTAGIKALPIHPGTLNNTAARSLPSKKLSFISYKASLHSGS